LKEEWASAALPPSMSDLPDHLARSANNNLTFLRADTIIAANFRCRKMGRFAQERSSYGALRARTVSTELTLRARMVGKITNCRRNGHPRRGAPPMPVPPSMGDFSDHF